MQHVLSAALLNELSLPTVKDALAIDLDQSVVDRSDLYPRSLRASAVFLTDVAGLRCDEAEVDHHRAHSLSLALVFPSQIEHSVRRVAPIVQGNVGHDVALAELLQVFKEAIRPVVADLGDAARNHRSNPGSARHRCRLERATRRCGADDDRAPDSVLALVHGDLVKAREQLRRFAWKQYWRQLLHQ